MLAWNDSLKRSSVFIEMGRIKRFIKSMKYYREQQEQVLLGSPAASMYRNVSAGLQQLLIVSIHTAIYRKTTLTNTADKWLQRACAAKHFRPAIVNIYAESSRQPPCGRGPNHRSRPAGQPFGEDREIFPGYYDRPCSNG